MKIIIWNSIRFILALLVLTAAVHTAASLYVSRKQGELKPADLLVVFPGAPERIAAGYRLAAEERATHFMIVNQPLPRMIKVAEKRGFAQKAQMLPGGKSRSSFEDAYQTVMTMQEMELDSVILVTSSYHLPRSLLLLKSCFALYGKSVDVQYYAVQNTSNKDKRIQIHYNELVKLWGSVTEMTGFFLTQKLLLDSPNVLSLRKRLKEFLLLRV